MTTAKQRCERANLLRMQIAINRMMPDELRCDDAVTRMVAALLAKVRAKEAGLPRLTCACGEELWADESLRVVCWKCFGAFRPVDGVEPQP